MIIKVVSARERKSDEREWGEKKIIRENHFKILRNIFSH